MTTEVMKDGTLVLSKKVIRKEDDIKFVLREAYQGYTRKEAKARFQKVLKSMSK